MAIGAVACAVAAEVTLRAGTVLAAVLVLESVKAVVDGELIVTVTGTVKAFVVPDR